jgi:hypothetical protein
VSLQDQLAGFLLAVDTSAGGPSAGMARVLRADRAVTLLTRVLDASGASDEVEGSCAVPRGPESATGKVGTVEQESGASSFGRADRTCGASIAAWSVPPVSVEFRAENLLGSGQSVVRWRAPVSAESTIDVHLCPSGRNSITRVRIDTRGCPATDNQELDMEVVVRSDAQRAFATLGYGAVPVGGVAEIASGSPMVGRDLILRLVSRRGTPQTACVGALAVD